MSCLFHKSIVFSADAQVAMSSLSGPVSFKTVHLSEHADFDKTAMTGDAWSG